MVLAFFDSKCLIYTNDKPWEITVNGKYIMEALCRFMKILKQKRQAMVAGEWWLHGDNAPVHTPGRGE
jgi:hypothetical protein